MSRKHHYRIHIERIPHADTEAAGEPAMSFGFASHDELFSIIEKLKARPDLGPDMAAPLGLGIKLFGSVMLENRQKEPFAGLFPHFSAFMKSFKRPQG